jgi:ABC-type glycerol-3-phosphate transport system substrate-binding protein
MPMASSRKKASFAKASLVLLAAAPLVISWAPIASASRLHVSVASQTVKIINWVNPGANQAFEKINAEFEKQYPNIKVQFITAANTAGPYLTLLETTVDSASADIVTWGSGDTEVQPMPPHPTRSTETLFQYWATHNVFLSMANHSSRTSPTVRSSP